MQHTVNVRGVSYKERNEAWLCVVRILLSLLSSRVTQLPGVSLRYLTTLMHSGHTINDKLVLVRNDNSVNVCSASPPI